MSGSHNRKGSRAALQRRTTRGPLDVDDPLSDSRSLSVSPAPPTVSPLIASTDFDNSPSAPLAASKLALEDGPPLTQDNASKDLSFLLDASIYHPLSNIDTPLPYRYPFPSTPAFNTSLRQVFSELADLLKRCHFVPAAYLAASVLTSGLVQPTDSSSIFRLLSIRYSALELSGNVLLAAQESKALEDLSSTFYYEEAPNVKTSIETATTQQPLLKHIMPFDLRLQAMRLQGIGFGDARRAVGALFDLGMECRDNLARVDAQEGVKWAERLDETGIRVVNALIDMNDLDCAKRTLKSMNSSKGSSNNLWMSRMILLLIKMGDIAEARSMFNDIDPVVPDRKVLGAFVEIADGKYDKATITLSQSAVEGADTTLLAIAKQNLAVAYLYTGEIQKSRKILEELVDEGYSFQALTVNLSTLYDLTSDKSKDLKTDLATKIANVQSQHPQRGFVNADFKL